MIAKHKQSGRLYEVDQIAHSAQNNPADDVCRCRMLSAYDGMPIGDSGWIPAKDLDFGIKSTDNLPIGQYPNQ
jgi:hypothetical protein